jgi:TATA-binding protein-associated factor
VGTSLATRQSAARQIGHLASQYCSQLPSIIQRIAKYLRSSSWETRIAASQAIGAIAENVAHTTVKDLLAQAGAHVHSDEKPRNSISIGKGASFGLTFADFDIQQVLERGAPLLASKGKEYDIDESKYTHAERVQRARQNLKKRLGLSEGVPGMDLDDMVGDADIVFTSSAHTPEAASAIQQEDAFAVVDAMVAPAGE